MSVKEYLDAGNEFTALDVELIASDLDGTILGPGGTVSARTVAAFDAAKKSGAKVVFVTGRPIRWLQPLREAFGHCGTVICSNGALIYDMDHGEVLGAHFIGVEAMRESRRRILEAFPDAIFALEAVGERDCLFLDTDFVEDAKKRAWHVEPEAVEEALARGVDGVKFLARSPSSEPDAFYAGVRELVADVVTPTHSAPGEPLVEMGPLGVDKAITLASFAAEHNIAPEHVIAFGDMPNDIPMLCWAGRGYAVGSGHPSVLQATPLHAAAFNDDGVAQVLEELFGNRAQL